jgi:predicted TIM-barrel fold metal-dependent hydrolase
VYRQYLPRRYHDELDAWMATFETTWDDLRATETLEYRRNHDTTIRQHDLEGDGIVGEVLYPNTIPPFAPPEGGHLTIDPHDAHDLELRWAGIHAHNRWLVDFCGEVPGRRAGVAQLLFEDVDRARAEIAWVSEQGLTGGVLIPNPGPQSTLPQLHAPLYEPIWTECEARGIPVHTHAGSGVPDYGPYSSSSVMMYMEFGWYALRPLVRLVLSGVLERHPDLTFVTTEIGNLTVIEALAELDHMVHQIRTAAPTSVEKHWAGPTIGELSLLPSEYWARQCYAGASLMTPAVSARRHDLGLDTMMWGADYPHYEGTHPYTGEALRNTFAGIAPDEVAQILGTNAVRAFGFDADALAPVVAEIGPLVAVVARPLAAHEFPPPDALTMSFPRPRTPVSGPSTTS